MKNIEIILPEDRNWKYRLLEMLPGLISWSVLAAPFILSFYSPQAASIFLISYLMLWFIRTIGLNYRSLQGANRIKEHEKIDWLALNKDLENLKVTVRGVPKWHAENVDRVKHWVPEKHRIKPSELIHVMMVANYSEPIEILEPTIQYIIDSKYDIKKVILLICYEQRGGPQIKVNADYLVKKYGSKFMYAEAIEHPDIGPDSFKGELRGKGGNITYAGYKFKEYVEKHHLDPLKLVVTTLDADNRPHPQYMAALTYMYCATEDPRHASYQPIPMFLNNIWDAPAPMRVIATGNSFWNVVLTLRPHAVRNFSSHAQSMAALIDTDFWSVRTVVEDGHQFWRTYFRYNGQHHVYPVSLPIYQDAVLASTYRKTIKAQFYQIRRWAWGASDVAYVFDKGFRRGNGVPKLDLLFKFLYMLESHVSWATMPLILGGGSLIPKLFKPDAYIANQLPRVVTNLNIVATLGVGVSLFLLFRFLPPKPERYKRSRSLVMVFQWVLLPFTTILFNALAALNSQTRLIFGKYLGKFDLTEKAVKK